MTLFEYLAIAFTLVLSLAATRLLAGLPYAVQSGRRYWVHLVFAVGQLLIIILASWNLWSFREADWTLPKFALTLLISGSIFFVAWTLMPE
jgi:hypothetical protein